MSEKEKKEYNIIIKGLLKRRRE